MDTKSNNFREAVLESAKNALEKANKADVAGDPATHVTAKVDGRTGFVVLFG